MVMIMDRGVGGMAIYSCEFGFALDGDMTRTCQENGQWTGSAPVCQCKSFLQNFFSCKSGVGSVLLNLSFF